MVFYGLFVNNFFDLVMSCQGLEMTKKAARQGPLLQ